MGQLSLFSLASLVYLATKVTALQCAFRYGRPKPQDCAYVSNHMIPIHDGPVALAYLPWHVPDGRPFLVLPVFYWYKTCIISISTPERPPIDPNYIWWTTMNRVKKATDDIIDECMVHGNHGWPPQSGGQEGLVRDLIQGETTLEIYGVPNYGKLYQAAGVLDGGELVGRSTASDIFLAYLASRAPGHHNQVPTNEPKPPSTPQRCRSCTAQRGCPKDYQCTASVQEFQNTRLMDGCCKLGAYSVSQGRRLLDNSSVLQDDNATFSALIPPETRFPLSGFGCPCNCTYVSQACCSASDGVVHEAASFKLGSLTPPNSTTCCDASTGDFGYKSRSQNSTFCWK